MNSKVHAYLQLPIVGVIDPASKTAGSYSTGWIDLSLFHRLYAVLLMGAISASGTVDAKFEQATSAAGAGAKDVTSVALAQSADTVADNTQASLEVRPAQLDVANSFRWVRLTVTTATAATILGAAVIGVSAKFEPATDLSTVLQTVAG